MGRRGFRLAIAALVIGGSLAACSANSSDDGGSSGDGGGSDAGVSTGVDETSVKVGYIYADLSALEGSGFVVEVGDSAAQAQAFTDALNDAGGVAGRTVDLTTYSFDPLAADPLAVQRAACLAATEDDEVFIVLAQVMFADPLLCVTSQHETPMIIQNSTSTELIDQADGRLFTTNFSWANAINEGVQLYGDSLDGQTVGLVYLDEPGLIEDLETGLEAPLADRGVDLVEKVVLPGTGGADTTAAIPAAIERLRGANIDSLFLALNSFVASTFITQSVQAGFEPTYYATDLNEDSTDLVPRMSPAGSMAGAQGVSWRATGSGEAGEEPAEFDQECVATYAEITGTAAPEPGGDEYGAIAGSCALFQLLERALDTAGSDLTREAFIAALAEQTDFPLGGGVTGSFGPDRYDAPNEIRPLEIQEPCSFGASAGKACWVPAGPYVPFER